MKIKWKIFVITFVKERLKHLKYVTILDREITETVRDLRKKVSVPDLKTAVHTPKLKEVHVADISRLRNSSKG